MAGQSERTVLITGASGGVGREIAREYAAAGFRVAVHYHRGLERAEQTLDALSGTGHCIVRADLSVAAAIPPFVDSVLSRMGRLDVLVNNAGIGERHAFADCDYRTWEAAWQRILAANLLGPAHLSFCAAKHMLTNAGGRIVNISSRGAFVGEPEQPWYGASKAGLNSLGQSLAKALAAQGVYVYTVAPGFIETPMSASALSGARGDRVRAEIPLGRVVTPGEVAELALFLGTDAPPSMTGAIVDINGASYLRT